MAKTIAVIGTLDTKGEEFQFVKKEIEKRSQSALVINVGIVKNPGFEPDVPAEDIAELKALMTEYREILNSDDEIERWAAIEIGLAHENAMIRKLAKDTAFASDDEALQTRALAAYVKSGASMAVRFEPPSKPDRGQQAMLKSYSALVIQAKSYDEQLDEFETAGGQCKIIPRGFECAIHYMRLEAKIASPTLLSGSATWHHGGPGAPVPLTIQLQ